MYDNASALFRSLFGHARNLGWLLPIDERKPAIWWSSLWRGVGVCCRCLQTIPDFRQPEKGECTAGYYVVQNGTWAKYANPGEVLVCDDCMWKDPLYIVDYSGSPHGT